MKKIHLSLFLLAAAFFINIPAFSATDPSDSYTQEREYIKKYVLYAKNYIEQNGKVTAITEFNNSRRDVRSKGLYIFGMVCGTVHADGFYLINPGIPSRIYVDKSDEPLTQKLMKAAMEHPDGSWLTYDWLNPATNRIEIKETYVLFMPKEQLCIGSGFYHPKS